MSHYNLLWYNHQQSDEVLWIKYKIFLLHDVSQAPGEQTSPGGNEEWYKNINEAEYDVETLQ